MRPYISFSPNTTLPHTPTPITLYSSHIGINYETWDTSALLSLMARYADLIHATFFDPTLAQRTPSGFTYQKCGSALEATVRSMRQNRNDVGHESCTRVMCARATIEALKLCVDLFAMAFAAFEANGWTAAYAGPVLDVLRFEHRPFCPPGGSALVFAAFIGSMVAMARKRIEAISRLGLEEVRLTISSSDLATVLGADNARAFAHFLQQLSVMRISFSGRGDAELHLSVDAIGPGSVVVYVTTMGRPSLSEIGLEELRTISEGVGGLDSVEVICAVEAEAVVEAEEAKASEAVGGGEEGNKAKRMRVTGKENSCEGGGPGAPSPVKALLDASRNKNI